MRMKSTRTHTRRIGRKPSLNGMVGERDRFGQAELHTGDKISDYSTDLVIQSINNRNYYLSQSHYETLQTANHRAKDATKYAFPHLSGRYSISPSQFGCR